MSALFIVERLEGLRCAPPGTARARVMSADMLDREPHYHLGLRFEDHDNELIRWLETWKAESRAGTPALPGWVGILQRDGLVSPDVLQTALRESEQDPERAGEWLLSNGKVYPLPEQATQSAVA